MNQYITNDHYSGHHLSQYAQVVLGYNTSQSSLMQYWLHLYLPFQSNLIKYLHQMESRQTDCKQTLISNYTIQLDIR